MAENTRRRRTPVAQEQELSQPEPAALAETVVPAAQTEQSGADELDSILAAQAELNHPSGTLDATTLFTQPTILADRSNTQLKSTDTMQLAGPTPDHPTPIAVVGRDGDVMPFSGEDRDRLSLLGYDVTYLYTKEDVKKVVAHNTKMLREGNVDRVMQGIRMVAPPLPNSDDSETLRENLAVAFSPSMLNR